MLPITSTKSVNLLEDDPTLLEPIQVIQARNFLKGESHPSSYYSVVAANHKQFPMSEIMQAIQRKYVLLVQEELNASNIERKSNSKARKPAEMWRDYSKDLRRIATTSESEDIQLIAHGLLIDIYAEQTQSEDSLASRDYKDSYTGELDTEDERPITTLEDLIESTDGNRTEEQGVQDLLKAIFYDFDVAREQAQALKALAPMSDMQRELHEIADKAAQDLGWDEATKAKFIKAQEMFDQDSDEEPIYDNTDHDMEEEQDYQLEENVWQEVGRVVGWFNKKRNEIIAAAHSQAEAEAPFAKWMNKGRIKFIVEALSKAALEDLTTAGIAAMRMITEYGIEDNNKRRVSIEEALCFPNLSLKDVPAPGYKSLYHYLGDHYDNLLDFTQMAGLKKADPLQAVQEVAVFGQSFMKDMEAMLPEYHAEPKQTRSYIMAYTRAMQGGATLKAAEETAYNAWRQAMDMNASKAYDAVMKQTGDAREAMKAFWRLCNKDVPRPQEAIAAILADKSGLRLENGREIKWHIVAMKIKGNELKLDQDTKARLLTALQKYNCGQTIWDLLK